MKWRCSSIKVALALINGPCFEFQPEHFQTSNKVDPGELRAVFSLTPRVTGEPNVSREAEEKQTEQQPSTSERGLTQEERCASLILSGFSSKHHDWSLRAFSNSHSFRFVETMGNIEIRNNISS